MVANTQDNTQELNHKLTTTPIAIIGMASILPMAHNLPEYWDNILKKLDCITDVPPSRWNIEDYYDPDPNALDKSYCKRGGFIPDINFDPMEYGLPPNILEVTDVSQLLGLVVAKDLLEDAGYGAGKTWDRQTCGVILGVVGMSSKVFSPFISRMQYPVWEKVLRSAGVSESDTQRIVEKIKSAYLNWDENAFPGAIVNVIAGRIANRFDLGGMNCVVDAACASSLAAVRMAIAELIEGRADMMITGGVDTDNSINTYMCFSETPAFTKGDRVQTFDADSGGMMVGEGIGLVMLKRLADAERDGDRIYAVIKGLGSSSDGRFKSIYAPRPSGQAIALRRAYKEAGFSPATVGLIDAHGTGTVAGDPAEFESLSIVFNEVDATRQSVALGSVKSQIGHTKATAGAASLIKTAMALHHKVLPATINVNKPNPKFDIENSAFYINTETRPWIQSNPDVPRRAAISSFGFGGTNYHLVMEEYNSDHQLAYRRHTVAQMVFLSAATPEELKALCTVTLNKLQGDQAAVFYNELVQQTLSGDQIPQNSARVGFVAESIDEARSFLQIVGDSINNRINDESWEHPKGIFYQKNGLDTVGKVVALFPGQGAQYLNMGSTLAINFPEIRQVISAMDRLFVEDGLEPISQVIYPHPVFDDVQRDAQSEKLQRTNHAQPAIGSLSVGMYHIFEKAGFKPDFVAGHSFGELTALWAGGVITEEDYLALAKARGKAMIPPADPNFDAGTMLAVKGDVEKVRAELQAFPEITLANLNSRNQVVLAGTKPDIQRVSDFLKEKGYSVVPLQVAAAFHTSLVGHAQKPFAEEINKVHFHKPSIPVYSNNTAKPHASQPKLIQKALADHILNPVLFKDEIDAIYQAGGTIFVEFGPKSVLSNLVDNILEGKPHLSVSVNANAKKDSDRQLREAYIHLRVAGLPLGNIDPYGIAKKVSLTKKSSVTVTLNGGLFITPKTRKAFETALTDGFKISSPQVVTPTIPMDLPMPKLELPTLPVQPEKVEKTVEIVAQETYEPVSIPPIETVSVSVMESILTSFQDHQAETAQLHEHYLQNESEYGRIFSELTQLQGSIVAQFASGKMDQLTGVLESIERSMARFHEHQQDTLRVHETYLKSQMEITQSYLDLLKGQQVGTPGTQTTVVSKHSYPDHPAKAVEIKPTIKEPAPLPLPKQTITTVSMPVQKEQGNGNGHAPSVVAPLAQTAAPVPAPVIPVAQPKVDAQQIKLVFLEIVSEKTGYPVEMLDMDMDMEADLGIDSIKRVEILGAMRERYPNLPKVSPEAFSEMRTLNQVIQHVGSELNGVDTEVVPPVRQEAAVVTSIPSQPEVKIPASEVQSAPVTPAPPVVSGGLLSEDDFKKLLLDVVSDKTGYPVEMLDLNMDMEADLGIDSIKRVEILGAVRERYPELPKVQPEEFSELKTLGQIVEFAVKKASPAERA